MPDQVPVYGTVDQPTRAEQIRYGCIAVIIVIAIVMHHYIRNRKAVNQSAMVVLPGTSTSNVVQPFVGMPGVTTNPHAVTFRLNSVQGLQ